MLFCTSGVHRNIKPDHRPCPFSHLATSSQYASSHPLIFCKAVTGNMWLGECTPVLAFTTDSHTRAQPGHLIFDQSPLGFSSRTPSNTRTWHHEYGTRQKHDPATPVKKLEAKNIESGFQNRACGASKTKRSCKSYGIENVVSFALPAIAYCSTFSIHKTSPRTNQHHAL